MTTLTQAFETFRKNLDPAEAPADAILARYRIREHVAATWQPVREGVIGSWRRGTNLRPTRELDYLFVLGPRHQPYVQADPAKCLDDVAARLDIAFPQVRTRKLGRGLGMLLGDVTVTLVPGFPKHGGGVFVPDTELRRWIPTDPDAHAAFTREVDRKVGGLGVPVVRALQCWRRAHGVGVRTFHLEVLALRALAASPEGFGAACAVALEGVAAGVRSRCAPPATVGDDVDQYLASSPDGRERVATAAGDAAGALREASERDAGGEHAAACALARQVFGAPFPEP